MARYELTTLCIALFAKKQEHEQAHCAMQPPGSERHVDPTNKTKRTV